MCTCGAYFSRSSSVARHITSKVGPGHQCDNCVRIFPRIDKLYDHLRDYHRFDQEAVDNYKTSKEWGRVEKTLRPIQPQPAPGPAPAPVSTTRTTSTGGFGSPWPRAGQNNGISGHNTMMMTPLSYGSIHPTHFTVRSLISNPRSVTRLAQLRLWLT